jgi:hypothetical protein
MHALNDVSNDPSRFLHMDLARVNPAKNLTVRYEDFHSPIRK